MTTYTIPRKDYQFLYIYEGTLFNYTLKNDEFHIIVNCVDYPDLPQELPTPSYSDWVKIKFKQFSYLKFPQSNVYYFVQLPLQFFSQRSCLAFSLQNELLMP